MTLHMKPGAKKHVPFSTSATSYGIYFVEPVVSQQGHYIMAGMMHCHRKKWLKRRMHANYGNPKAKKDSTYVYTQSIMKFHISVMTIHNIQLSYISKFNLSSQTLCFEVRRKCGVGFIHTQLTSSYANAPQQLASSPSTVGFITRDFHAILSRHHSQTKRRGLHTLFLASKSRCMQKISSVDALLTIQNVLSWSGRFGGGHTGWSQLQLASSVSPLWRLVAYSAPSHYLNQYWVNV